MSQGMDATFELQGVYETVLRAYSALMDRIIDQFERGELPSDVDMREELRLRAKLDLAVAGWCRTGAPVL